MTVVSRVTALRLAFRGGGGGGGKVQPSGMDDWGSSGCNGRI